MKTQKIQSLKDYNWVETLNAGFGKKKDYSKKLDELNNIINELASDYMILHEKYADEMEDIRRIVINTEINK